MANICLAILKSFQVFSLPIASNELVDVMLTAPKHILFSFEVGQTMFSAILTVLIKLMFEYYWVLLMKY